MVNQLFMGGACSLLIFSPFVYYTSDKVQRYPPSQGYRQFLLSVAFLLFVICLVLSFFFNPWFQKECAGTPAP